ncbi:YadA-like family protein [Vibrio lamellibrachiae]|uniref:YadA-like family protein n=1 Tax=Vibrio lamellibrachiae TaxID=2910253 RepID=UPI003D119234
MKKLLVSVCIATVTISGAAVADADTPIQDGLVEASIVRHSDNEAIDSYIKAGWKPNGETEQQAAAQDILAGIAAGEFSEEQLQFMQNFSLNNGSTSGEVSMLASVATDAAKGMSEEQITAFNTKHGTEYTSGDELASAIYTYAVDNTDESKFDDQNSRYQELNQNVRQEERQSSPERQELKSAFQEQASNYNGEVQQRVDNSTAMMQATVNARPMVTDGQTAIGAGAGFAGDSEAMAIGVSHAFNENWSASSTVSATSETDNVDSEVSFGAGAQYVF